MSINYIKTSFSSKIFLEELIILYFAVQTSDLLVTAIHSPLGSIFPAQADYDDQNSKTINELF